MPENGYFRQFSSVVRRTTTGFKGGPFGTAHVSPRVYIAVVPDTGKKRQRTVVAHTLYLQFTHTLAAGTHTLPTEYIQFASTLNTNQEANE